MSKIFLGFLLFYITDQTHCMENTNLSSYIYQQLKNQFNRYISAEFRNSFYRDIEIAQDSKFLLEDCEKIKKAIQDGADPNWKIGNNDQTLLNLAITNQKKDLFEFLLEKKADINMGDKDNFTPLHALAMTYNRHEKLDIQIKDLLNHKADIQATTVCGLTPLHAAVWSCSSECIKLLIKYNADINEKNNAMTPLTLAIFDNESETPDEIIKTLCTLRASLAFVDNKSKNNIFHALASNVTAIKYFKPIIIHARFDNYDKASKKTVLYTLWVLKYWNPTNVPLSTDTKLHILSKLPLSDLYPYKGICTLLLQRNYAHILLPQVHERVENIKQILATPGNINKTALQYALEKFENNQNHLNSLRPFLDGTLLQKNYDDFIKYFPNILNSELEEDKNNLVRQMFDNCVKLFLDDSSKQQQLNPH